MSCKKNNNNKKLQELILKGYKVPSKEDMNLKPEQSDQSCVPRTLMKYSKLYQEEVKMNKYILQLKCLLKNLTVLEEGMIYIGSMKPILFDSIYVLAQMQVKLYKFRNRLGNLPKQHRKYAYNLTENVYETIIDQCVKGAQGEHFLKEIVTEVAFIDHLMAKYTKNTVKKRKFPFRMNICSWLKKNNMGKAFKLNYKKIIKNECTFKLIDDTRDKKHSKLKIKNCDGRESSFLEKIGELTKEKKTNTADKYVSAHVETVSVATQFDPILSGSLYDPNGPNELENNIKNLWLANTRASSNRASIDEQLPPENEFHYDVSMRHASTNVIIDQDTKETQTKIAVVPSEDYEYTVMDMKYTKTREVEEKTPEEMIENLHHRPIFFLDETDIFETITPSTYEESDSSSGTVIEDSDCNIKISNIKSEPCYRKYKMHYSANKNAENIGSKNGRSVLINNDTIEHKDEILTYIKELGSIFAKSYRDEKGEDSSETDH